MGIDIIGPLIRIIGYLIAFILLGVFFSAIVYGVYSFFRSLVRKVGALINLNLEKKRGIF